MKKSIAAIIAGTMIIFMFGMNIDHIQSGASTEIPKNTPTSKFTTIADDKSKNAISFNIPILIPCADLKSAEEQMLKEGLKILATGLVSPEEIVEVWVGVEKKNFVVVKIHPTIGVTCLLTGGPLLKPGGDYLDSNKETPKKNPM